MYNMITSFIHYSETDFVLFFLCALFCVCSSVCKCVCFWVCARTCALVESSCSAVSFMYTKIIML